MELLQPEGHADALANQVEIEYWKSALTSSALLVGRLAISAGNSARMLSHSESVSVAVLLALLGSVAPIGEVTVAVFEREPVTVALIVPLAL